MVKIADEFFTFIVDCKAPKACTILLRGASKDMLNEVCVCVGGGGGQGVKSCLTWWGAGSQKCAPPPPRPAPLPWWTLF